MVKRKYLKKHKTQKLWNMKGCSKYRCKKNITKRTKKKYGGCFFGKTKSKKQKGGCTSCLTGGVQLQTGGSSGNLYPLNTYKNDLQTSTIPSRGLKGGASLIPQEITNIGRNMIYGAGSAYNSLSGFAAPVNPLPYSQFPINTISKNLGYF